MQTALDTRMPLPQQRASPEKGKWPQLGVGWSRQSKARSEGSKRQPDHLYLSPDGKKFRSIKQAAAHAAGEPGRGKEEVT